MARYESSSKKKKKKKKNRLRKSVDNFYLVVDLDKALTSGGEPANPGFKRMSFTGTTSEADGHTHSFSLQIDNGVVTGITDAVDGHTHSINANTGGQLDIRIPTSLNIPTVQTQFIESEGDQGNGVPVAIRPSQAHVHSVSFTI